MDAQALRAAYWDQGETFVTLGARYGKAPGTIHGWFKKFGIPTRSCGESKKLQERAVGPEEIQQMVELYAGGLSSEEVGAKLGRDGRLVRTHLERAGVLRSHTEGADLAVRNGKIRTTTLNERFFETLTPASAWALGLIFGDGHVQIIKGRQYGIHLAGSQQVLEEVAEHLGHNREPKRMRKRVEFEWKLLNCWKLVWYSKAMTKDLERFGLTGGNKAHTMEWPSGISEELLPHFVRGLWDSDGSWTRWDLVNGGYSISANYACASDEFIQSLKERLTLKGWDTKISQFLTPLNGKLFSCNRLYVPACHSKDLARWLYADTTPELRCGRKFGIATQEALKPC